MDLVESSGPDDWKKRQEAVDSTIADVAKGGSELAKKISQRKENQGKNDKNCSVIQMLCDEACSQLRKGEMSVKEVVTDLCEALETLADVKEKPKDEKKEKGE